MKIGLYSDSLAQLPLGKFLDFCEERGLSHVEFGTGNWSSAPHVNLGELTTSKDRRDELLHEVGARRLRISALNCSGNPLHPGGAGEAHRVVTRRTIELASMLGIDRVVTMSGCPAGPGDRHPNWITTSWPPETTTILEWQWREHVLPYWRETVALARDHGVRLCFEMHGSQCVYNVETFERLRDANDDTVGLNFDPSHLLWMGANPILVARRLAGSIHHVHAKDTRVEAAADINSRLDAKRVKPVDGRSWNFVAVGRGQDLGFWSGLIEELRAGGYDDVMSIENEDYSLSAESAVDQAVSFLAGIVGRGGKRDVPEPARGRSPGPHL
jgi:sugar phosphate isomerase/epimerase